MRKKKEKKWFMKVYFKEHCNLVSFYTLISKEDIGFWRTKLTEGKEEWVSVHEVDGGISSMKQKDVEFITFYSE